MKKIVRILPALLLIGSIGMAQNLSNEKVPATVTKAFSTKFSTATKVKWEIDDDGTYEAEFKMGGIEMSANFDGSGVWLETETEVKLAELPVAVQTTLSRDFAAYKIEETCKIESATKGISYEAEIEQGESTFEIYMDMDGKIIGRKMLEGKEEKDSH